MKLVNGAFLICILLAGCDISGNGRYQIAEASGNLWRVDTRNGTLWKCYGLDGGCVLVNPDPLTD
ncbi:MAG TPA: hypothetical protein VIO39_01955 [Methylotenera sp.]